MTLNLGTVRPGSTILIPFNTFDSNDPSASVAIAAFILGDIGIYKDLSMTERGSTTGVVLLDTDGIDLDAAVGIGGFTIDLSSNATAGFYASGSRYYVTVGPVTVDAAVVNFLSATFDIGWPDALINTTVASATSDTQFILTDGPAEADVLIGCSVAIQAVAAARGVGIQIGYISDYIVTTKEVFLAADPGGGTVTAADNVAIFMPVGVGAMRAAVLNAAAIGADAITNAKIADDAIAVENIKDAALTAAKFAANAITATVIADAAITAAKITALDSTAWGNAQNFFDTTGWVGGTIKLTVDATAISGDATAADNLELFTEVLENATGLIDAGTFKAGAINAAAIATDAITAAKIAAAAIDNATFAADVGSTAYATNIIALAVRKALDEIKLDHLVAVAVADEVVDNSIIAKLANSGATADWSAYVNTTDSLMAIRDHATTIKSETALIVEDTGTTLPGTLEGLTLFGKSSVDDTGNSTTKVDLGAANAGSYADDELNGFFLVLFDNGTSEYHVREITDYTATGELATVATLPFTPATDDFYWLLSAQAGSSSAPTASAVADAVWDRDATSNQDAGSFGQAIGDPGANTETIYDAVVTDATGVNVATDVVAVKAETALIVADTGTDGVVLAADAITAAKIADNAIATEHLATGAISADTLATDTITAAKIAANAITSSEIADGAITVAKITALDSTAWGNAQNFFDTTGWVGGTIKLTADMVKISGDATAADNLEEGATVIVTGLAETGTLSTTVMTSDLTEATDDHYIGRTVIWTTGALAGQASDITDYLGSTGQLTYSTVTDVPSNGDAFVIV